MLKIFQDISLNNFSQFLQFLKILSALWFQLTLAVRFLQCHRATHSGSHPTDFSHFQKDSFYKIASVENCNFFFAHTQRTILRRGEARSYSRSRQKFLAVPLYRLCKENCESWVSTFLFANGYNSDKASISTLCSDRSTSFTNSLKKKMLSAVESFSTF